MRVLINLLFSWLIIKPAYAASNALAGECNAPSDNDQLLNTNNVDYLIVGAGGGGIQTALLLQKYGHSVQILEKQQTAGSFWTRYPRFQELISVNKRVANETQIMRYDWHSMLETPIRMWDISHDYFPSGLGKQKLIVHNGHNPPFDLVIMCILIVKPVMNVCKCKRHTHLAVD